MVCVELVNVFLFCLSCVHSSCKYVPWIHPVHKWRRTVRSYGTMRGRRAVGRPVRPHRAVWRHGRMHSGRGPMWTKIRRTGRPQKLVMRWRRRTTWVHRPWTQMMRWRSRPHHSRRRRPIGTTEWERRSRRWYIGWTRRSGTTRWVPPQRSWWWARGATIWRWIWHTRSANPIEVTGRRLKVIGRWGSTMVPRRSTIHRTHGSHGPGTGYRWNGHWHTNWRQGNAARSWRRGSRVAGGTTHVASAAIAAAALRSWGRATGHKLRRTSSRGVRRSRWRSVEGPGESGRSRSGHPSWPGGGWGSRGRAERHAVNRRPPSWAPRAKVSLPAWDGLF